MTDKRLTIIDLARGPRQLDLLRDAVTIRTTNGYGERVAPIAEQAGVAIVLSMPERRGGRIPRDPYGGWARTVDEIDVAPYLPLLRECVRVAGSRHEPGARTIAPNQTGGKRTRRKHASRTVGAVLWRIGDAIERRTS